MSVYILCHIIALGAGILMDWIIGDPHSFPHPVRLIGAYIAFWERKLFPSAEKGGRRNRELEQTRGAILSVCVLLTVTAVTGGILWLSYRIHPFAGTAVETVMTCFVLAARSLWSESMKVPAALKKGSLKVKTHRKVAWESSNISIAKVSSKGKITAVKKGTCYIYAYAQNGVCATIKVTVT